MVVVRDGSVILTGGIGTRPVSAGAVVLVAPGVLFGYTPEGRATVTTVLLDTDYLIDAFFWQHLDLFADQQMARDLAVRLYPDRLQVLRVGERVVERLAPVLDDLITVTAGEPGAAGFFRLQVLVSEVLGVVAPHVRAAPGVPMPTPRGPCADVPRWRVFFPAPVKVAETTVLMRADLARRWRLPDLAAHACLSVSQYARVFRHAYGLTPVTYLTMLRARETARLLRESDLGVLAIYQQAGWGQRSHAAVAFRRYYGTTPSGYRRHGPATASVLGPGVTVAVPAAERGNGCAPTY
nr:AraC family transcriptional regulator [Nonomuraea sp. K271]